MPNEVYEMTHTALSALVSHRAATRVLDAALSSSGANADTVTVRAMRRLLAGTVRKELGATLPSPGLTRSLKQIADDLYHLQPSHTTRVEMVPPEEPAALGKRVAETVPIRAGSTRTASRPGPADAAQPPARPQPKATLSVPSHRAPTLAPPAAPADLTVERELDESVMTSALRLFGELEQVDQVVVVRAGEVLLERGTGMATTRLPNLARSTRHLLARAGRLRLFALEREEGMLFVFPLGEGAIVVLTKQNVNIGAVLAARAALEEAA